MEFGGRVLTHDWAWLLGGVFLTSIVREIVGGLGYITRLVLREFFIHGALATAGASIDFGVQSERLHFLLPFHDW